MNDGGAAVLFVEQIIPAGVRARAEALLLDNSARFDRDEDSVDGSPTFEIKWVAEGKYRNKSLEAIFRETIETRIVPALQASPLCPKGRGQELTLCEGLVRVYDDDIRRVHPAHYDADALVTAVFELDGGGGGGYDGQGFYVQPGAHVSTRLPMSMRPGDLIAHGFDLQHGVEVRRGRRLSVILWFTCSPESCVSKRRPWYEEAAEAGDPDAMYNVAKGLDREQSDPKRALSLMRAAAAAGSFTAQNDVAAMLMAGKGCPNAEPLLDEAEQWLSLAASQGFHRAQVGMAKLCAARGEEAAAFAWMLAAAEQRADPDVAFRVGVAYRDGLGGVDRDESRAQAWLRDAAELGHPRAQLELGALANDEVWLHRAHMQGELGAAVALARLYGARGDVARLADVLRRLALRFAHVSSKQSWMRSIIALRATLVGLPLAISGVMVAAPHLIH